MGEGIMSWEDILKFRGPDGKLYDSKKTYEKVTGLTSSQKANLKRLNQEGLSKYGDKWRPNYLRPDKIKRSDYNKIVNDAKKAMGKLASRAKYEKTREMDKTNESAKRRVAQETLDAKEGLSPEYSPKYGESGCASLARKLGWGRRPLRHERVMDDLEEQNRVNEILERNAEIDAEQAQEFEDEDKTTRRAEINRKTRQTKQRNKIRD